MVAQQSCFLHSSALAHKLFVFLSSTCGLLLFFPRSVVLLPRSLSVSAAPAAAPVSVAPPPPPPMVQLTPQIPLTGFVARMQESSKYSSQPVDMH